MCKYIWWTPHIPKPSLVVAHMPEIHLGTATQSLQGLMWPIRPHVDPGIFLMYVLFKQLLTD